MAGKVRQPIDLKALEKYIDQNVPEIKTPLDLKQVLFDSEMGTDEQLISMIIVRLRPIESHLSINSCGWHQICHAQETTRQTPLEYCSPSRSRISNNTCLGGHRCTCAKGNMHVRGRIGCWNTFLYHVILGRKIHYRASLPRRFGGRTDRDVSKMNLLVRV